MELKDLSLLTENELQLINEGKFLDWLKGIIKGAKNKISPASIKQGSIVVYDYNSKLYEEGKLHFFDAFPLVLVTSIDGGNFFGFNLHYVPVRIKKQFVKYLKKQYPKEFKNKDYKRPLPKFNYPKVKKQFPYMADATIHQYIKRRSKRITTISTGDLVGLSFIDTSKFEFTKDSELKSVEAIHKKWRSSKSLQQRNIKTKP